MQTFRSVIRSVMQAVGISALSWSVSALAALPDKPISLVAPFAAGGNADVLARQLGAALSGPLGQPIIVENKPGAGSMLGSQFVARAKADGQTFLLGSFANVLNEFFYNKKLLDLKKDLVPVAQLVSIPNYIAVSPTSRYQSLKELLDDAKKRPGQVTCATSGVGTSSHLLCEMLNQQFGVQITAVPYRGGVPAITDVMAGQASFVAGNEALPYIRDKRLKGLAVSSAERSAFAPDLPAVAELQPGFSMVSWFGVFAPAGTPKPVVDQMSQVIAGALKTPAMKERLDALGATPVGSSAAQFNAFVLAELARWERILKPMNIRLD